MTLPINAVPRSSRSRPRTIVATALVVTAAVLVSLANVVLWARDTALDTDTYVDTVAPLITDDELTALVATELTDLVFENVGAEALASQFLPDVVDGLSSLVGPADDLLRPLVEEQIEGLLQSGAVAGLWETVNREVHELLIDALTGGNRYLGVDGDRVVLDLEPALEGLGDQLADRGLDLADVDVPDGAAQVTVFESAEIGDAVEAIDRLESLSWLLPVLAAALLAGGLAVAPRRGRALAWAGVALVASSLMFLVGQVVVSDWAIGSLTEPIAELAGRSLWDVAGARLGGRTLVLVAVGCVVVVVGFGPAIVRRRRGSVAP